MCDVTDEAAVPRTFDRVGPVDVLVNNAGFAESAPLARTTLADWRRHLDVNATGAVPVHARGAARDARARTAGAIVTVASTAGRVGAPLHARYTASKHAAVGLTRAVAAEVGGHRRDRQRGLPTFVRHGR